MISPTIWSMTWTLMSSTSERDIPGLRGTPAVTTTTSASCMAAGSLLPVTRVSNSKKGAVWKISSATPCGTSSRISIRTTSRQVSCSARICAVVSPTRPAPTIATFCIVFLQYALSSGQPRSPELRRGKPRYSWKTQRLFWTFSRNSGRTKENAQPGLRAQCETATAACVQKAG